MIHYLGLFILVYETVTFLLECIIMYRPIVQDCREHLPELQTKIQHTMPQFTLFTPPAVPGLDGGRVLSNLTWAISSPVPLYVICA